MADDADPAEPLYLVAPADFVAARNALAGELKKAGKKAEAAAVKALTKPSVPAFAVNQVARKHPAAVAGFLASSDEIARAQSGGVGNEIARKAYQAALALQREALERLRGLAAEALTAAGLEPGRSVLERVESNLRFAVVAEELRQRLQAGRLVVDLEAPDFSALVGRIPLAPRVGKSDGDDGEADGEAPPAAKAAPRIVPPVPEQDARRAARAAAATLARRLRAELDKADAEVSRARKHAWAQKTAHDRAQAQRDELRAKLDAAVAEVATRARAHSEADDALAQAEGRRAELAAELDSATAAAK
jgi:hypothetical protein